MRNARSAGATGKTMAADVLKAAVWALFVISAAVVLVLNFRPLYYADIRLLHIPEISGMDEARIRENYDALIRYNSLFHRGALEFPSLPMSEGGRIHFAEVKRIFDFLQVVLLASGLFAAGMALRCCIRRRSGGKDRFRAAVKDAAGSGRPGTEGAAGGNRSLRLAGRICLILPAVLCLLAVIGWDRFFVLFHKVFFRNDYWLFDPAEDPVILMLPDQFFFHCAAAIFLLVMAGGAALLILGRRGTKR